MKIEVGDRDRARAIFRHLEPTPLLRNTDSGLTDSDIYEFIEKLIDQLDSTVEWQVVPNLPWYDWEINKRGDIRHRQSKTPLTPFYDEQSDRMVVTVGNGEKKYWLYGPGIAELMNWEESEDAGTKDS